MSENTYLKSLQASRDNAVAMLKALEAGEMSRENIHHRSAILRSQIETLDALIEAEKARGH